MSEIIYLKDILLAKSSTKKKKRTTVGRPKLKPFKYERIMKSFLIEKEKKEDRK
ncbi:MAG: hypothetical protein LBO73_03300 [Holosporaceae bacterium]|jgi:hypothetical protein|nr:hypothetical protein [Holosporaceae bacterium]